MGSLVVVLNDDLAAVCSKLPLQLLGFDDRRSSDLSQSQNSHVFVADSGRIWQNPGRGKKGGNFGILEVVIWLHRE
jgi:hypothetical protein